MRALDIDGSVQEICLNYNINISVQKAKTMEFMSKYPLQTKTVLDNKDIKLVSHLRNLGCDL